MSVYQAIAKVSKAMSQDGIAKGRSNAQQGYKFRGIDDVLNALSSALVDAGLVILPRVLSREVVERQTAKGGTLFYVTVNVEFDLVSTEDGTKHTVSTYGEAMDSADKATNKAMSAAYKYLALLTFCIPTEATPENDADFSTHTVVRQNDPARKAWLAARQREIEASATVGDLRAVLQEAITKAMEQNDSAAVDQLTAWAEEKKAQAKPKVAA